MPPLETSIRTKIGSLQAGERFRALRPIPASEKLISFASNDYLGFSQHPELKKAAVQAIEQQGVGAGGSRLLSGNHSWYETLERQLASLKNTEAACVFGSGYLTAIGVIPALVGRGDLVVADRLVHASLVDGIRLSGAKLVRFKHNDPASLESLLRKYRANYANCLVVTETVFSMDGDVAPLLDIQAVAERFESALLTDDAHGLGFLDPAKNPAPLQMGTLSKAVGCYGGYLCASKTVVDYIISSARSLMYSTALPSSIVAAASKAIEIIEHDPKLCQLPLARARYFCGLMGLAEPQSPIVPIVLGNTETALRASAFLKQAGFYVPAIRPPTVPEGTSRLRLSFTALHQEKDIERLAEVIRTRV